MIKGATGAKPLNLLVLAGTQEARTVIDQLADDRRFAVTASLAGATATPQPLAAPVHRGGFGGAEGMAAFCRDQEIDAIVDLTHPFARHISRNAAQAAAILNLPCIAYHRPPWHPEPGDEWREFDDWQSMADAIPAGKRIFLAGGTASIEVFTRRHDIVLWARALNVSGYTNGERVTYINAMPEADMESEKALFTRHGIELLCCKNAGGTASVAKIEAARAMRMPIWLLARAKREKSVPNVEFHDSLTALLDAILRLVEPQ